MESNDIRELFTKEIVEKANKEMTDKDSKRRKTNDQRFWRLHGV